ncbi:cytochrome C assembly family protein [Paludibacterium yongneupense]|uniref:cytochrome C assembly family protein n=1 Tax=Paludibacterium yongneupense TaxID=400061 RepID=UPI00040C2C3F|nr:cytochrome c biogenesis protein CcsA [Paludibacterium yongneupense]
MNGFLPLLTLVLILAYGVLSRHVLLHWQDESASTRNLRREYLLLGGLLLLHALAVLAPFAQGAVLSVGVGRVLALVVWLMLVIYWTCSFFYRLDGLQLFMMPLAMLSLAFAQFFPGDHILHDPGSPALVLHILVSVLAYSLFAIAVLIALLMLALERALHDKRGSTLVRRLPPLLSLEKMMFQVIAVGFSLLSVSLVSGSVFSEELFGKPAMFTHKTVFGVMSWLLFGLLLLGRRLRGWRGRVAIRWTLAGFAALMLAYIGSKIVLELILHRP